MWGSISDTDTDTINLSIFQYWDQPDTTLNKQAVNNRFVWVHFTYPVVNYVLNIEPFHSLSADLCYSYPDTSVLRVLVMLIVQAFSSDTELDNWRLTEWTSNKTHNKTQRMYVCIYVCIYLFNYVFSCQYV